MIQLRAGRIDVLLGADSLHQIGEYCAANNLARRCAIISDTNVAAHFADRVQRSLNACGFESTLIVIPAGEQSKTLEQAGAICDQMITAGLDRQSFVIGLGGGVVGDISGFVAAIFHRGIRHVQIPTTLLAMVDSSIGGKTGVNTGAGKNLLGAIHPPVLVLDDVDVLRTLPPRDFKQGFAEIIKHAIIADAEMFEQVAQVSNLRRDEKARWTLAPLIQRNVQIKSEVVAKDERDETGARALLNFGHTVGHAIERAGEYRQLLHGEAVSLGIVAACKISVKRAGLPREQCDAAADVLRRFDLPVQLPPDLPRDRILAALKFDKKFERGEIRFVLTPKIGSAYLSCDVTLDDVQSAIDELQVARC